MSNPNYIRTNTFHCNNCDFHTFDKNKWNVHLTRAKHIKNTELSNKECRLCGDKFTAEGYSRHLDENLSLLKLWNNRNHHTGVGYNADSWQIGFKEYGGHVGELLPKCNINQAWKRKFNNFNETITFIKSQFKKEYDGSKRPQRGKLSNPFLYLSLKQCAPYEELTEEEEAIWEANDNKFKDEMSKKNTVKSIESLEKLLNFKFSELELEHGYYVDLNRDEDYKFSKKTYAFCDFIGVYRPNLYLKEFLEIQKEYKSHILFVPSEANKRFGMFYLENSSNGTYEEIAEWKEPLRNGIDDCEMLWLIESDSESDSEEED